MNHTSAVSVSVWWTEISGTPPQGRLLPRWPQNPEAQQHTLANTTHTLTTHTQEANQKGTFVQNHSVKSSMSLHSCNCSCWSHQL